MNTLFVTDFKYGRVAVSIAGNTQLRMYALGEILRLIQEDQPLPGKIVLGIIQPRVSDVPLTEELTVEELLAWGEDVLRPGAARALQINAPRIPGPTQCQWCNGKAHCPELAEYAVTTTELTLAEFKGGAPFNPPAPSTLEPALLATIGNRAALIGKWLEACEAEIVARLCTGKEVPEWKLVRGRRGNKEWAVPEDAVAAVLRTNYGLANETIFKHAINTPAVMFKLPSVKDAPELLATLITQKEGALCAAPSSDKRPAALKAPATAAEFSTTD